jgi:hypothetical protein
VGVAELKYESGCIEVALLRFYKDFGIMQNHFHTWNQQRPNVVIITIFHYFIKIGIEQT